MSADPYPAVPPPRARAFPDGGAAPRRRGWTLPDRVPDDGFVDMLTVSPGQIVFLNGTSSSGKSSIAEQLLQVLERPYFHMSIDAVNAMRAKARTAELPPDELAAVLTRTRAGFHRAIAGMARAGNDLVVDHVLSEEWRLLDCLTVLAGLDVVFVGVRCSPDELERRERARGDRPPGLAAAQFAQVHAHGVYDVECDTTLASPGECALAIKQFLASGTPRTAFGRLRSAHLPPGTGIPAPQRH